MDLFELGDYVGDIAASRRGLCFPIIFAHLDLTLPAAKLHIFPNVESKGNMNLTWLLQTQAFYFLMNLAEQRKWMDKTSGTNSPRFIWIPRTQHYMPVNTKIVPKSILGWFFPSIYFSGQVEDEAYSFVITELQCNWAKKGRRGAAKWRRRLTNLGKVRRRRSFVLQWPSFGYVTYHFELVIEWLDSIGRFWRFSSIVLNIQMSLHFSTQNSTAHRLKVVLKLKKPFAWINSWRLSLMSKSWPNDDTSLPTYPRQTSFVAIAVEYYHAFF